MTDSSPGLLLERMQAIEDELEEMKNNWADAEEQMVRRNAQVKKLAAPERLRLKKSPPPGVGKPTKEDLDALVLDWLWNEHGELMEAHLEAEAKCAAFQTIYKVSEKTLSSKQSRLKADLKLSPGRAE